ncbi:hypothetical protein GCM10007423_61850 [Dyadobacter endophyticus]|uniref:Uncharacterized protein n=1 Tax=Dyadobacter endophyticus TaxID=1749036 RepID=A0ABQ1ZCH8_9BACT|nr:hypothetical protein GCM10007423_61850 [Dyadobacter endophyticus]
MKSTARYKFVGVVVKNCRINLMFTLNFFKYSPKSVKQYVTDSKYMFRADFYQFLRID